MKVGEQGEVEGEREDGRGGGRAENTILGVHTVVIRTNHGV